MLDNVLIPLDGSTRAEDAVDEARNIVAENGKIQLITVVQKPSIPFYGYEMASTFQTSYQSALEEGLTRAKDYIERIAQELCLDGFRVSTIVEYGDFPASIIVSKALQYEVSAIVMSTHGRSGVTRWLLGSVTNEVLAGAPCPVMVIPGKQHSHVSPNVTFSSKQKDYVN